MIATSLAAKKAPETAGSLQVETPTLALTLITIVVLLTLLQFMPVLVLGLLPINFCWLKAKEASENEYANSCK